MVLVNVGNIRGPAGAPWTLPLTENLTFAPDNTYDIGLVAANRPRDVNVGRDILIGTPNVRLRNPAARPNSLSIESTDYLMLSGQDGAVLAANARWDGTNWQRFNTGNPAWYTSIGGGFELSSAAAGANPITWTTRFGLDINGNITAYGALWFSPDSTQDIGQAANLRPRDLFLGRNLTAAGDARFGPGGAVETFIMGSAIGFGDFPNGTCWLSKPANAPDRIRVWPQLDVIGNLIVSNDIRADGTAYATGAILTNDLRVSRASVAQPTQGYVLFGTTGPHYVGFDGTTFRFGPTPTQIVASGPVLAPGDVSVMNGGFHAYTHTLQGHYAFWAPNVAGVAGEGIARVWNVHSSLKYKRNIAPLRDPLALVQNDALHAIEYDTVNAQPVASPEQTHSIGFVADAWLPHVPEIVSVDDEGQAVAMDYSRVGAITFEALKRYIAQTEARLAALEAARETGD